MVTKPLNYW